MAAPVVVQLDLPKDWRKFRLPPALHRRLQQLLDRQDAEGRLSRQERREAAALAQLVDMLSLMRLWAEAVAKRHEFAKEVGRQ